MSMSVIGLIVALLLIAVIWFAFVAPSERRYHERKLRLMQERIERRKQRTEGGDSTPHDNVTDNER